MGDEECREVEPHGRTDVVEIRDHGPEVGECGPGGVATQSEVDAALAQLAELANDTTSAVSSPRLFQCWARKP